MSLGDEENGLSLEIINNPAKAFRKGIFESPKRYAMKVAGQLGEVRGGGMGEAVVRTERLATSDRLADVVDLLRVVAETTDDKSDGRTAFGDLLKRVDDRKPVNGKTKVVEPTIAGWPTEGIFSALMAVGGATLKEGQVENPGKLADMNLAIRKDPDEVLKTIRAAAKDMGIKQEEVLGLEAVMQVMFPESGLGQYGSSDEIEFKAGLIARMKVVMSDSFRIIGDQVRAEADAYRINSFGTAYPAARRIEQGRKDMKQQQEVRNRNPGVVAAFEAAFGESGSNNGQDPPQQGDQSRKFVIKEFTNSGY